MGSFVAIFKALLMLLLDQGFLGKVFLTDLSASVGEALQAM